MIFLNGLSAEERANLIKQALCLVHETSVDFVPITCDGSSSNIASVTALGANLDADNSIHYFLHPVTTKPIYIILDACHMLKLVRNALATTQYIVDQSENLIKWEHIT